MMIRRWLIWGLFALLLAAVLFWAFRPRPTVVETAVARLGLFEHTVDEDGLVRVRSRYLVASPSAGRADRITLRVGDSILPGDQVATIRPLPPALQDARALSELREAYGAAQASQLRAKANVARARAALRQARADYLRAKELADQGFTARSQAETASLLLTQQIQALKAAEFENESAVHQAQMAKATLQRTDEISATDDAGGQTLATVPVYSPVAGRVLKLLHESERAVSPGTELLEIGDTSQLEAVIDVLSEEATSLRAGMSVRLKAGGAAQTLFGQISRIEPVAHTKVSTLGVEEQRVNVVVEFATGARPIVLGDGYRVDARIVTLAERDAMLVPIGALIRDADGWHVFVVQNGRVQLRPVQVASRNNTQVWVKAGLEVGEEVVVYPPDTLASGHAIEAGAG